MQTFNSKIVSYEKSLDKDEGDQVPPTDLA
jgi:hypothetical protein